MTEERQLVEDYANGVKVYALPDLLVANDVSMGLIEIDLQKLNEASQGRNKLECAIRLPKQK